MLEPDDWVCTSGQLAEVFGVTHKILSRWHARGMPKIDRGLWDLRACVQWMLTYYATGGDGEGDAAGQQALVEAREALINSQRRKLDLEHELALRQVYDADLVKAAFRRTTGIVLDHHNALPALAPRLVGKDEDVIETELDGAIREIETALSHAFRAFEVSGGADLDAMEAATE